MEAPAILMLQRQYFAKMVNKVSYLHFGKYYDDVLDIIISEAVYMQVRKDFMCKMMAPFSSKIRNEN